VDDVFAKIDLDGGGSISFKEFALYMADRDGIIINDTVEEVHELLTKQRAVARVDQFPLEGSRDALAAGSPKASTNFWA
jgi:hypothetical protein